MRLGLNARLSFMMFLEYVIWGAWLPLLTTYLGKNYLDFSGFEIAWIMNAFAIASLTGMFFGGQLADRYFAQEKFLAFSHLVGGLAMLGLVFTERFWPFFGLMLLHCFFFVPTLSITNAISFANLEDAREFGKIRVWGTIGWIAASWPFVFIPIDWAQVPAMADAGGLVSWLGTALSTLKTGDAMKAALTSTFIVSGVASLALAAFSLVLPHTPPVAKTDDSFAPLKALKLLAVPSILVLFIVTFLDATVHYCYFFWTGPFFKSIGLTENWIPVAMSIGQMAEIATMAFLGYFLKRLGWRTTMIIGVLGQTLRFFVYSIGTPETVWLVILINIAHGFAYAFFFAAVYIFVDENFPKDVRTSAQGLFNLLILGVGPFLGNFLWGGLGDLVFTDQTTKAVNFQGLFLVPSALGLVSAVILVLFFHPPKSAVETHEVEPALVG